MKNMVWKYCRSISPEWKQQVWGAQAASLVIGALGTAGGVLACASWSEGVLPAPRWSLQLEAAVSLEKQRELVLWASLLWLIEAVWSLIGPASCTLMIRVSGLCALCLPTRCWRRKAPPRSDDLA